MAKRERKQDSGGNEDKTAVLFTSLNMILLAFFIMLVSMSTMDSRRQRLAIGSLVGGFGVLPAGIGIDPKGSMLDAGAPMKQGGNREIIFREFIIAMKRAGALKGVRVEINDTGRAFKMQDDLLFAPGASVLSPASFFLLDRLAGLIRRLDTPVVVGGHADRRGSELSNWRLSLERATTVYRYFVELGAVPERLVRLEAFGSMEPLPHLRPDDVHNRRVELRFN